jgi:hypothetical protein
VCVGSCDLDGARAAGAARDHGRCGRHGVAAGALPNPPRPTLAFRVTVEAECQNGVSELEWLSVLVASKRNGCRCVASSVCQLNRQHLTPGRIIAPPHTTPLRHRSQQPLALPNAQGVRGLTQRLGKRAAAARLAVLLAAQGCALRYGVPPTLALYPIKASLPAGHLEPQFHGADPTRMLFFNKGL